MAVIETTDAKIAYFTYSDMQEAIARSNNAFKKVQELRREYGVAPGESLWEAITGNQFPLSGRIDDGNR